MKILPHENFAPYGSPLHNWLLNGLAMLLSMENIACVVKTSKDAFVPCTLSNYNRIILSVLLLNVINNYLMYTWSQWTIPNRRQWNAIKVKSHLERHHVYIHLQRGHTGTQDRTGSIHFELTRSVNTNQSAPIHSELDQHSVVVGIDPAQYRVPVWTLTRTEIDLDGYGLAVIWACHVHMCTSMPLFTKPHLYPRLNIGADMGIVLLSSYQSPVT